MNSYVFVLRSDLIFRDCKAFQMYIFVYISTCSSWPLSHGRQISVYMFPPTKKSTSTNIMNSQENRKLNPALL